MFPAVAHVVGVADHGLARLQELAQLDLGGADGRVRVPGLAPYRLAIDLPADLELPEVLVEPPHRRLDDIVQAFQGDRGRDLDLSPDQRIRIDQLDPHGGDLFGAVGGRSHAASLPGP